MCGVRTTANSNFSCDILFTQFPPFHEASTGMSTINKTRTSESKSWGSTEVKVTTPIFLRLEVVKDFKQYT